MRQGLPRRAAISSNNRVGKAAIARSVFFSGAWHMLKSYLKAGVAAAVLVGSASSANAVEIFYQQGFSNNLYRYDTATATETLVGSMGLNADSTGLAFSSAGGLYAYERASQSLYTVNTTTGAATLVGATGVDAEDLTIVGSTGYISSGRGLFSVNLTTGAATLIGGNASMDGLTTSSTAINFFGSPYAAGSIFGVDSGTIFAIDLATGNATSIGTSNGADETFDFGPGGVLYGHGDDGFLYTINLANGAETVLTATTPGLVFGMAVRPGPAVPEPATWAMMIAGFGFAGASLRMRRTKISFA
jgi:hypothetical protein